MSAVAVHTIYVTTTLEPEGVDAARRECGRGTLDAMASLSDIQNAPRRAKGTRPPATPVFHGHVKKYTRGHVENPRGTIPKPFEQNKKLQRHPTPRAGTPVPFSREPPSHPRARDPGPSRPALEQSVHTHVHIHVTCAHTCDRRPRFASIYMYVPSCLQTFR